jgi:hypothetical protein
MSYNSTFSFLSSNGISRGKKIHILLTLGKCCTVACVLSFPKCRELFLYRTGYGGGGGIIGCSAAGGGV